MKFSTRSRYGTRLVLDMAQNFDGHPIQLGEIAKRQNISLKYLEQIIRPLKKANYIKSYRGAKGGHMLTRGPEEITVGEIVAVLEGGDRLTPCSQKPEACERAADCVTRYIWQQASEAMFARLNQITFADIIATDKQICKESTWII
jgi:Rrf2 family protein